MFRVIQVSKDRWTNLKVWDDFGMAGPKIEYISFLDKKIDKNKIKHVNVNFYFKDSYMYHYLLKSEYLMYRFKI